MVLTNEIHTITNVNLRWYGLSILLPSIFTCLHSIGVDRPFEYKAPPQMIAFISQSLFKYFLYDKTEKYAQTLHAQYTDGDWIVTLESDFNIQNLTGNCAELSVKMILILQVIFPLNPFFLVEDTHYFDTWNHFGIIHMHQNVPNKLRKKTFINRKSLEACFTYFKKQKTGIDECLFIDPSKRSVQSLGQSGFRVSSIKYHHAFTTFKVIYSSYDSPILLPFVIHHTQSTLYGFGLSLYFESGCSEIKLCYYTDDKREIVNCDESLLQNQTLLHNGYTREYLTGLLEKISRLKVDKL